MIEDNLDIVDIMAQILKRGLPEVDFISTILGKEGIELVRTKSPDVVILDLGLPDMDGLQVLQQIRSFSNVPVMILTVRGEEEDRIKGLEAGADDYIIKPFSVREFLARLKALLRRIEIYETRGSGVDMSVKGDKLKIDFDSGTVTIGDMPLKLGPRMYELLSLLVKNKGKVLSNEMLLNSVFPEQRNDIRYLDVYIKKLREALRDDPASPRMIIKDGRNGYKFIGS